MKLYYTKGACSLSVRILIHELGIPCEFEEVNLSVKKTKTGDDYYSINPKGVVPALKLDNGEILTENAAIHQYLAETNKAYNLLPAAPEFKRYRVLEWLIFITTDLHKGASPLFNREIPQDVKDKVFKPNWKNKFKIVDKQLEKNKYLMGEDYMLPDDYLFVMLTWANNFKIDLSDLKNLLRYFELMKERPSVKTALQEEGIKL